VARVGLSGFRTPYAFGYVTLAEGPRVFARLLDRDGGEDGLQVGAPVTLAEAPIALTDPDRTVPGIVFQVSGPEEG